MKGGGLAELGAGEAAIEVVFGSESPEVGVEVVVADEGFGPVGSEEGEGENN